MNISHIFRRAVVAAAVTLVIPVAMAQSGNIAERFGKAVNAHVDRNYAEVEALYKDLHAHPELAFEEINTSKRLAKALRDLGFEVTEGLGKTGVVGLLRNGSGLTIMVRTELDALPMEEKTGLPYASKVKTGYLGKETFVAHSCGHDIHMASWVGAARTLVAMKSQWKGTLMFVAQPAEEVLGGAKAMLDDGLFKRFGKPDFAFALHTWPMAYGEIGFNVGPVTSNSDSFEAVFHGRGAHGSAPDKSIDPILIASRFVVDVQGVISREKDPFQFGVFSIGAIQGGTSGNIIPDNVALRGTIRSYDQGVRSKLHEGIQRTAKGAAVAAGAPEPEVKIIAGGNAVVNNAALVERTEATLISALGVNVKRMPPITPSEDFSEYAGAGVQVMFFLVGVYDPKDVVASRLPGAKPLPGNHSPFFAPVPEPTIKTSIKAMSLAVLTALGN
ncbi:MAG: peptidase M20 [Burkholderiales bacterium PBB3]|nr:MAG: peptidase M20 [Burkholderiales bacterium PBB3]